MILTTFAIAQRQSLDGANRRGGVARDAASIAHVQGGKNKSHITAAQSERPSPDAARERANGFPNRNSRRRPFPSRRCNRTLFVPTSRERQRLGEEGVLECACRSVAVATSVLSSRARLGSDSKRSFSLGCCRDRGSCSSCLTSSPRLFRSHGVSVEALRAPFALRGAQKFAHLASSHSHSIVSSHHNALKNTRKTLW